MQDVTAALALEIILVEDKYDLTEIPKPPILDKGKMQLTVKCVPKKQPKIAFVTMPVMLLAAATVAMSFHIH
jgi:hypothetical protein